MELGTGLAICAFADQCLKYGNKFIRRCKSYLHAEEESIELLIAIEANWIKMETQILILRKIAPKLNKTLQDMQSQILSQLEGKLKTASLTIDQLMKQKSDEEKRQKELFKHDTREIGVLIKDLRGIPGLTKVKYTSKKKPLLQIVEDIEKWQTKAGQDQIPIVVAAKGIRDATRDRQDGGNKGQGTIWIEAGDIDLKPQSIPFSSIETSMIEDHQLVLIDTMHLNPAANVDETKRKTRKLARILAEVEPTIFGLLRCKGVVKWPKVPEPLDCNFKFIFEVPRNLQNPQSLRAVLLAGHPYPLNERLELAKRLTSSVLFVHTVQFVHKNIRPETIIVFEDERSSIGAQFLAGFDQFRVEDGATVQLGDDHWERNLYRHTTRQGLHPEVYYQMQHDIYSLEVVLLEIGLWTSFVGYDPDHRDPSPSSELLQGALKTTPEFPIGYPLSVKNNLEALAERELPSRLGERYTEIVLLCLKCLDEETISDKGDVGKGFGVDLPDWKDEDGLVIGVRYIENVLEKIQGLSI